MSEENNQEDTGRGNGKNNGGKKEVAFDEPLIATTITVGEEYGYGSMDTSVTEVLDDDEDDSAPLVDRRKFFRRRTSSMDSSNHRYSLLTNNMFTSSRKISNKFQLETVPSEMKNNIKLVTDPNLDVNEKGSVYINEASIYMTGVEPEYALTVNTDIYSRILQEINDSFDVPCGLYFCCHGGDGAHSGVSHDDHVDIRLAWIALFFILGTMMVFEMVTPDVDDAFYGND